MGEFGWLGFVWFGLVGLFWQDLFGMFGWVGLDLHFLNTYIFCISLHVLVSKGEIILVSKTVKVFGIVVIFSIYQQGPSETIPSHSWVPSKPSDV